MSRRLPRLGADLEIWGHWWLPSNEDQKLPGRLKSKGGAFQLKLLGHFSMIDPNKLFEKVPVIHGAGEANAFTLWNSVQDQFGFKSPGTIEQHFSGMRVLAGGFLPDRGEVRFTALTLNNVNLGAWLGLRPVMTTFSTTQPFQYKFELAEDRERAVTLKKSGCVATFGYGWSTINDEFQRYGLDIFPKARFEFAGGLPFEDLLEVGGQWQKLFSLLIGEEFVLETSSVEIDGGGKLDKVFDLRFDHMPPVERDPLHVNDVLVPFGALGSNAGEVFDAWSEELPRIKDAVDLFLGTTRQRSLPAPSALTALAQSLETFHRNVHGGEHMMIDAQSEGDGNCTCGEHAKKKKVKITFRHRLEQLVKGFDDELLKSIGIDGDVFIETVKDARNHFTHWDFETKTFRLKVADLDNLVTRLQAFTRLVLLAHIGVSPQVVARRMLENKHRFLTETVGIDWGK